MFRTLTRPLPESLHRAAQTLSLIAIVIMAAALLGSLFARNSSVNGISANFTIYDADGTLLAANRSAFRIAQAGVYRITLHTANVVPDAVVIRDRNIRLHQSPLDGSRIDQSSQGLVWWRNSGKTSSTDSITIYSIGHSTVNIHVLDAAAARKSINKEIENSTLFAGGLAMMTIFATVVALVARDKLFGTFAYWLWSTLLLGSITAGYDLLWFGASPAANLETATKQLICANWGVAAIALFMGLFSKQLGTRLLTSALRTCYHIFIGFCMAAPLVPTHIFMAAFWATAMLGLLLLACGVLALWSSGFSRGSIWYGLGWLAQITALVRDVLGASGIMERPQLPPFILASVISALFIGLAVAESLNSERAEREKAYDIAEIARAKLAHLFTSSPTGLLSFDRTGKGTAANPQALHLLGLPLGALPNLSNILDDRLHSELSELASREEKELHRRISIQTRSDGGKTFLAVRARTTTESIEVSVQDVTASVELEEHLRQQAFTDPLTGLKNFAALVRDLQIGQSNSTPLALYLIDIHRFRDVNTFFGQRSGDRALKEVANNLMCIDYGGMPYRVTGDTFALLASHLDDSALHTHARRIARELAQNPIDLGRRSVSIQVYIAAQPINACSDTDELLLSTQSLLEEARTLTFGTERIAISNSDSVRRWRESQRFTNLIQSREWTREVQLYAQPIVALTDDSDERFEILLRITTDRGVIPPSPLLQAAESLGAMTEIDIFVVERTLEWMERRATLPKYVTCNLSGASISDPSFLDTLYSLLQKHSQAARRLCLEVTESVAVQDVKRAADFFENLHTLGVLIALDDFGAGYTNFTYLSQLPVDILKLDGQFVKDFQSSPRKALIISNLTKLTHNLGAKCVAEWVEDQDCANELANIGVDFAQGWHFSKAQPLDYWDSNEFPRFELTAAVSPQ